MGLFDEMMLEHSKLNCNADAEVEEIEDRKDSIDPEKSPKKSTQILNEEHDARHYTNGIMDLINEGVLEQDWIVQGLLKWMSEDDVAEFARYYGVADIIDGVEDIDESLKESVNQKLKKNLSEDLKLLSDLGDYEPWSGAVETWDKIVQEDKVDQLDFELEMIYPDGLTVTELNDILWFEPEWVFELLGISDEDDDDLDEACKNKKRSKNKKKIKESVDGNLVNEVAEFLENSVEELKSDPGSGGCCTYQFPWSVLGVCVGWASGFDPNDPNVIHDPSEPEWAIDSAIKVWTSDDLRTDFEWINMPYNKDDGEVWDTSVSISPEEDYRSLAEWFVKQYEEMSKYEITEQGEIIDKYGERTYRVTNIVWDNYGGNEDPLPEEYKVTIEVDPDDDYEDIQAKLAYALEDEFPNAEVLELDFDRLEESLTEDISTAFEFDSKKYLDELRNGIDDYKGYKIEPVKYLHDETEGYSYAIVKNGTIVGGADSILDAKHKIDQNVGRNPFLDPELPDDMKLSEDTVKKSNGKWTNRGDTGEEHGEFKTKKAADAQRKAMYARGYKGESKKKVTERNLTRSERHNRNMDRIFNTKKEQDKKFADFLRGKGYSEDEIKSLENADKLNAEIHDKFGGSKAIGDILRESYLIDIALDEIVKDIRNDYTYGLLGDGTSWALNFGDDILDEADIEEIVNAIKEDHTSGITGNGVTWDLDMDFLADKYNQDEYDDWYDDRYDDWDEEIEESKKRVTESNDDKIVIYKSLGKYRTTPESNYNARIQNARQVHELDDFNSAEEIIDYYVKYGWAKGRDDFKIIDESKKRVKESADDDSCYEYKGYTICNDNKRGLWTIKELKDETFSTDKDAEERVDNMLDESFLKEKSFVKLGTDVGHFQELVDYDMERYGRVSVDTRRKIRNAGLSLVTDEYGDVEVIAHDPIDYRQNRRDKFHTREYSYEEEALDPTTGEEIEDEDVDDPRGNRGVGLTRI